MNNMKDWSRGYFCALAKLIEADGTVTATTESLFHAGGDWRVADNLDIEIFVTHGLITRQTAPPTTKAK